MDRNRRNFIQGIFGGVVGSSIIIEATQKDIQAFADPLKLADPIYAGPLQTPDPSDQNNWYLYNRHGEKVAIITNIGLRTLPTDMGADEFGNARFIPGIRKIDIQVECIGSIDPHYDGQGFPELRGFK
jgi:hypothetical protein